jgi:hypothetical protein
LRQLSMRPSPKHDIANFRTLASKIPSADIAAKLGRSLPATAVTAHHPGSPLRRASAPIRILDHQPLRRRWKARTCRHRDRSICAPGTDCLEEIMVEKHPRSDHAVKLGSISFGRSKTVCTIRSISAFGAALDVAADEQVPDEFALTVIPDGGPRRCAVVWRKEKRIAVAFY